MSKVVRLLSLSALLLILVSCQATKQKANPERTLATADECPSCAFKSLGGSVELFGKYATPERMCSSIYTDVCVQDDVASMIDTRLEALEEAAKEFNSETIKKMMGAWGGYADPVSKMAQSHGLVFEKEKLEEYLKERFEEGIWSSIDTETEASVSYCKKQESMITSTYSVKDQEQMDEFLKKVKFFKEIHESNIVSIVRRHPMIFVQKVSDACASIKELVKKAESEPYKSESAKKIFAYLQESYDDSYCDESHKLQVLAGDLFRSGRSYLNDDEVQEVVKPHLPVLFVSKYISDSDSEEEEAALEVEFALEKAKMGSVCSTYEGVVSSWLSQLLAQIQEEVALDKENINKLLEERYGVNRHYSGAIHGKFKAMFEIAKQGVLHFVSNHFSEDHKEPILKTINDMTLWWPELFDVEHFVEKETILGNKREMLDLTKVPQDHPGILAIELGFSAGFNAFYTGITPAAQGQVHFLPSFVELAKEDPYPIFAVMAHEIGHHIDPASAGPRNNFDTRKDFAPMLQCLSQKDSVNLQAEQWSEAGADVVAAEVVAWVLSQASFQEQGEDMNKDEGIEKLRRELALRSVSSYCYMIHQSEGQWSFRARHPNTMIRLDGIFAGNASLRKVMGCEEPGKYRVCSMKGAVQ